ncbi:MAG TPA: lysoplasmalogenase [Leptospiraceae bacterium]|nr:lysoplasmalogenase [Leptospirales bacterium]HMU85599.1 lysoplasmalogenase [Leptospiraceae bacterium]HMX56065.1 lysoplasmalogenase [Leptospiraceae bacterium]HMZ35237.1 lysoplasmalogenase [Leptospiraceae bacterium]HNE24760.1 lysoplasmalogenase [Leptospiraceae bacterium]
MIFLFLAIYLSAAGFSIYCRYNNRPLYNFAKGIPLVLLFIYYLFHPSGSGLYYWFVIALLSGLIGDLLLLREKTFRYGALFFSLGHLFYVGAFYVMGGWPKIGVLVLIFGYMAIYCAFLYKRLEETGGVGNVWLGLPYLFLVSLLLVFASATAGHVAALGVPAQLEPLPLFVIDASIFVGALLFYVSDLVLVWNRNAGTFKEAQFVILSTYYLAQLFIAMGAIGHLN